MSELKAIEQRNFGVRCDGGYTSYLPREKSKVAIGADLKSAEAAIGSMITKSDFRPIDSAPKGNGAKNTTDPNYIAPPVILLLFKDDNVSVGCWDWYYAAGGRGYKGGEAWIEPCSGELLDLHYDSPIGWLPLLQ